MAVIAGRIKEQSTLTAQMEYGQHGLVLTLKYIPFAQFLRIEGNCKKNEWNPQTHQRSEELDRKKMSLELARVAVLGWNLTGEMVQSMVDMEEYPPAGEIPYSPEDCAALLDGDIDLYLFVRDNCRQMALFDAVRRAAETKNSSDSLGENSALGLVRRGPSLVQNA